jgi:formylglycine-generating enzyme required for sulfatase activity
MSDIFISYSSEDKGRVQALARALERKGWSVWWDRRIPAGKSFDDVIHEALKAARSVVVVWTKTSVKSTWVKNESRSGLRRNILFPVMLLDEVEIPLEFEHLQAAHLMDWQPEEEHAGFDQFIDDLAGVIGAPVTQSQGTPASPAKPTPEPETGLLQGAVQAVLLSGNNNLSALTLSPGNLEPTFVASTTDYTANVASDVTSVTISASKADPNAVLSGCVTVGSGTATGQASIPLNGPGTVTPAVFTIAAPNGSSKTYRIMVNRVALSGNNSLSTLTISPGSLSPAFSANTLNYTVNVGSNVTNVTVSAAKADLNALISGDVSAVAGVATGQATIQLSGPGTTTGVTIWVSAPRGSQKTYTLNVARAALSGNNNLQRLSVSPGTLSPSFSASRTAYTVNVGADVTSVTVTPTLQDDNSSVTINGQGANKRQSQSVVLSGPGSNTVIDTVVTAPNGVQKIYTVEVYRAAEVDPASERWDATSASDMGDSRHPDSSRETVTSERTTEFPGDDRELVQPSDDRTSHSTGTGQSTESLPYLPIGLGILAALGALAYFVVFSQGPSPVKRDVVPYQTTVQPPSTRPEVIAPTPAPEPITQPAPATTQEEPVARQRAGFAKTINGKDGAPMVPVPAGEFMMGDDKSGQNDERPSHPVYLGAFYIDQYEVTTSRYAKFFQETNRPVPEYWSAQVLRQHGRKPVVGVDWSDATTYCSWAGKRLPTEAEWEKAARGTDQRVYPWGNAAPNTTLANYNRGFDFKQYAALTDVGSFEQGKSPYGAYDMAGNVWEWTADWYDEHYYGKSPERNPKGPSSAEYRVIRGGSWLLAPVPVRSAYRLRSPPLGTGRPYRVPLRPGRSELTFSL